MKTIQLTLLIFVVITSLFSCSIEEPSLDNPLNQTILTKLKNAGYCDKNVRTISKDTFLIEGDIEMTSRFNEVDFALTFSRANTGMAAITILRKESLPSDTYVEEYVSEIGGLKGYAQFYLFWGVHIFRNLNFFGYSSLGQNARQTSLLSKYLPIERQTIKETTEADP